jgi:hypothetical protein
MITVDAPRCRVPPPCCWLPSGHADACPVGQSAHVAVPQPIFTVVCGPRWSIRPDHLSQLERPLPSRSSISIDDGVCGAQIPIAPAAASPSLSRDFLHWPFAYAGRRCMPHHRHGRHPQTFTKPALSECNKVREQRMQLLFQPRQYLRIAPSGGEAEHLDGLEVRPVYPRS